MTIRVLVADDQPLMCSASSTCLSAEPDIEVVGEARTGFGRSTWPGRCVPMWF